MRRDSPGDKWMSCVSLPLSVTRRAGGIIARPWAGGQPARCAALCRPCRLEELGRHRVLQLPGHRNGAVTIVAAQCLGRAEEEKGRCRFVFNSLRQASKEEDGVAALHEMKVVLSRCAGLTSVCLTFPVKQ